MKADLKMMIISIGIIANIIVGLFIYKGVSLSDVKSHLSNIVDSSVVGVKNVLSSNNNDTQESNVDAVIENNTIDISIPEEVVEDIAVEANRNIVYDGMTLDELAAKLDRSLGSTLSGTGYQFASRAIELGVDPYMAVGIVLLETGCSWDCSALVNQCYNVGGQKGSPGCWGGEYQAFNSLEEGINAFMDNLYYNYVAYGLTTPELINPKYAESTEWAQAVNSYIGLIRSR